MHNPTNMEIANGILNYDIKVYRYLDKIYKPRIIKHIKSKAGTKEEVNLLKKVDTKFM